ncbi:MAG: hypothetical protein ACPG8W_14850 [Candidatus Promineifilaceae bacterium]
MLIARPDIEIYEEITISDTNGQLEMRGADGELLAKPFEMRVRLRQSAIERAFSEASRASQSYAQRTLDVYGSSSYDPLREIGTTLYNNLFGGRRHIMFEEKVDQARQLSQGVRLNFEFTSAEFSDLPWEILHDSFNFISLSSSVQIARRLRDAQAHQYEPLNHVDVLVISMNKAANALIDQIKLMHQQDNEGATTVRVISAEDLPAQLSTLRYDLLHVISGHDSRRLMSKADRQEQSIPLRSLRRSIESQQPRLVVLQTTDSDRSAQVLAPRSGAVVTVRSSVSAKAKVAFANGLYRSLFTEHSIDQAVAAARQEIDLQIPGSREWGLPRYYRPPVARLPLLQIEPDKTDGVSGTSAEIDKPTGSSREQQRLQIRLHIEQLNLNSLTSQAKEYRSIPEQLQQKITATRKSVADLQSKLTQ